MPHFARELHGRRFFQAAVVLFGAACGADGQAGSTTPEEGLASAREKIQALAAGSGNALPRFEPAFAPGEEPRPGFVRNVPMLRVSTPWKAGETLWIQVPEHSWTHLPDAPDTRRLLFAGDDISNLTPRLRSRPFAQTAAASWMERADGGIELRSALSGGVSVTYQALPGDRFFELRFGVTNSSEVPLLETFSQFCLVFREFEALKQQSPETSWMLADGGVVGWGDAGQDLSWIEAMRDPDSGLLTKPCFFQALVRGCADERYPPKEYQARDFMWLRRTLDAPIVVKSSPDRRRHFALYSPFGRTIMYNALGPCCHVDPYMDGVAPGETRWSVVYGIFFEGELGELCAKLGEVDRVLRRTAGFLRE